MSTTTKVVIGGAALVAVYFIVKQLAPQPKTGAAQVLDSLGGIVSAFQGNTASTPSAYIAPNPYSTPTAKPDALGVQRTMRTQLPPQNTLTYQQASMLGLAAR